MDDFRSPAELGQYLKYLDGNDTAYSQYFKWRGRGGPEVYLLIFIACIFSGELFDVHTMCRVCSVLNYIENSGIKR